MARIISYGEPRHGGDCVAAGVVRSVQGDDFGEELDEGRAGDARDGELCSGVRGGGGVEPSGRDKDAGNEHEGGGGEGGAVQRRGGLRGEDDQSGGVNGALQRIYSDHIEAGSVYRGFVRHTRTSSHIV